MECVYRALIYKPHNEPSHCEMAFPRSFQTCSIGLRSGDFAGQSIWWISFSSRKSLTLWVLCGLALLSVTWKSGPAASGKTSREFHRLHPYSAVRWHYPHQRGAAVYNFPTWCRPRQGLNIMVWRPPKWYIPLRLLGWQRASGPL